MIHDLKPYPAYKDSGVPWLGQVPEHWEVKRQRNVVKMLVSNVDKHVLENEDTVRLCNYTDVYKNDKITERITFMHATASIDEIRRFKLKVGDVIITKDSETWNDIAVPALVECEAPDLICGYHLAILRPFIDLISGAYLFRALQSQGVESQYYVSANGVTRYGLSHEAIKSVLIPVPSIPEQSAIVRYLDYMDRRIRRYIHAKQKLIKLLEEQKQAIIHRAVTRGLDPDVKLKPSGVEWLGDVPEHWEIRRIKSLSQVKRGASPRPIDDMRYFDVNGEYSWVRISDVTASDFYLEKTSEKLSTLGKSFSVSLEPGTLFLSIAGSVGKPIITKVKCCIHDGFVYFPQYRGNTEFLYYIFASGKAYAGLGKLGTQLNLNTDTVANIRVPWPSLIEQSQIVEYLNTKLKKLNETITFTNQIIYLLHEYRTRLIADVVTGKLDVQAAVAILPDEVEEPEVLEDEESTEVDPEGEPEENIGED